MGFTCAATRRISGKNGRVPGTASLGACLEVVPGFVLCVAADAFGVPGGDVDGAACLPSVVSAEEWQLLEGKLESGFLQAFWEAFGAKG